MKQFFIPSKTFLLGEYLALSHGLGILATHAPYFKIEVPGRNPTTFHPQSLAGQYQEKHSLILEFTDPHKSLGGFGRSGAECIGLSLATSKSAVDPWSIYSNFSSQGSGLDLLAQTYGINQEKNQVLFIDKNQKKIEPLPTLGLSLSIFHTQKKLPTHEHLKNLQQESFAPLSSIFRAALASWQTQDAESFLEKSSKYQRVLKELGLLAPHSDSALEDLNSFSFVLGAKACGAMGSDTLIVYTKTQDPPLKEWQRKHSLLEIHQFPV